MDHFPLNQSHKVDRKALLASLKNVKTSSKATSHQDDQRFLKVFQTALGREIGFDDDFFELGGDSLRVVECVIKLEALCQVSLEMDTFYEYRTPKKIIDQIKKKMVVKPAPEMPKIPTGKTQIAVSELRLGTITDVVPASYTQRLYYYKKKVNLVSFSVKLQASFSAAHITHAVAMVAKYNPALRTSLGFVDDQLKMRVHEAIQTAKVAVVTAPADREQFEVKIQKKLEDAVFRARYTQGALFNYVIIESPDSQTLEVCVDHCVFDASCIAIFKEDLTKVLAGKQPLKRGVTYAQYCQRLMQSHILTEILHHPYTHQLVASNQACAQLFEQVPLGSSHVVVKHVTVFEGTQLSYLISYLSSKELVAAYGLTTVTSNLILNLRNFSEFSAVDTIGDLHSTVQLIYSAGESYADFNRRSQTVVEKLFTGELYNPRSVTYQNYPELSENQRELRKIIGNDVPISISFVGLVEPADLSSYAASIAAAQHQLAQTADLSRIYATAVLCRDQLHIFYDHQVYPQQKTFDFTQIQ
ncbi:phosphopantetheine-binding protein [Pediococcus siamensis]|uniref:phosphopantetheine-binding protein n=1 Tax=Pediococcus siamensis TaxID=381829 RepID=UPI0039A39C3C